MKFCIAFLKQLRRSAVLNFLFSVKYIHKNCKLAYRSDSAVFAHNTENRKLRTAMNSCRGFPNCNTETHFCWFPAISFPTPSPFEYPADEPFKITTTPPSPRNKLSRTRKQNDPPPRPRGASHRQGEPIEDWGNEETRTTGDCWYVIGKPLEEL